MTTVRSVPLSTSFATATPVLLRHSVVTGQGDGTVA